MMTTTAFWLTGMPPPEQPLPQALFCGWMRRGEANKEPKSKRKRDPKEPQKGKKSKDRSASGELHGKRTGAVSSPGPAVGGSPGLVDKKVPAQAGAELPAQAAKKSSSCWQSCCRLKKPQSWSSQAQGQHWQSCKTHLVLVLAIGYDSSRWQRIRQ